MHDEDTAGWWRYPPDCVVGGVVRPGTLGDYAPPTVHRSPGLRSVLLGVPGPPRPPVRLRHPSATGGDAPIPAVRVVGVLLATMWAGDRVPVPAEAILEQQTPLLMAGR